MSTIARSEGKKTFQPTSPNGIFPVFLNIKTAYAEKNRTTLEITARETITSISNEVILKIADDEISSRKETTAKKTKGSGVVI